METEGNVAAALTDLMENCAGGKRKPMVETLQRNPGTIHSFSEFRDRLGCPFPKLFPVTVASVTLAPPKPPVSSPELRAAIAGGEVLAGSKNIKGLQRSLKSALGKASNPPDCSKPPCKAALKAAIEPPIVKYEIKLAKIQRAPRAASDTAAEQSKLEAESVATILADDANQEKRDRKKVIKAALAGVGGALHAAGPILKRDTLEVREQAPPQPEQGGRPLPQGPEERRAARLADAAAGVVPAAAQGAQDSDSGPDAGSPDRPAHDHDADARHLPGQRGQRQADRSGRQTQPGSGGSRRQSHLQLPLRRPGDPGRQLDAGGVERAPPRARTHRGLEPRRAFGGDSGHTASSAPTCERIPERATTALSS